MLEISAALRERIAGAGQLHLLKWFDELDENSRREYIAQLENVDWESIPLLAADYVLKRPETAIPDDLTPAQYFRIADKNMAVRYAEADARGIELLKQMKASE